MKWITATIAGLVVLLAGLAVFARLAPVDSERWHQMPGTVANRDLQGGAMRVVIAGENGLERLDDIIRETPRTRIVAGSVEQGMVTYETRSAMFGFPDYTTVRRNGSRIEIFGRLRFGASDLGVNAARIEGWLKAFAQRG